MIVKFTFSFPLSHFVCFQSCPPVCDLTGSVHSYLTSHNSLAWLAQAEGQTSGFAVDHQNHPDFAAIGLMDFCWRAASSYDAEWDKNDAG